MPALRSKLAGMQLSRAPHVADCSDTERSADDFEASLLHHVQQLEGGARGLLLPDFPLLYRREAGVQQTGKDSLADARAFAD